MCAITMHIMQTSKPQLLVILGPTAVGKSSLAVQIAEWIAQEKVGDYSGAEIISADSRQVYTGLDIGTGKITTEEMNGITHHLLDVADPHERFTAIQWKTLAEKAITEITAKGRLAILCGGTGFYISTLIDDLGFPDVEADTEEQNKLETMSVDELFQELKKVDPARSSTIDPKNKRRLARAIIIARKLGSVPAIKVPSEPPYETLQIGITTPDEKLKGKIHARLIQRLDSGMAEEVKKLHLAPPDGIGLSYERMDELGLEYRFVSYFLVCHSRESGNPESLHKHTKLCLKTKDELIERLSSKIWQYAKRQMTWFKRDERIKWFDASQVKEIQNEISKFLHK